MKYTVNKLDARYSYHLWFSHYIGFTTRMSNSGGPLDFNIALQWMVKTYGWSAEVKQYQEIHQWFKISKSVPFIRGSNRNLTPKITEDLPPEVNPHWSWSNQYDDFRIYVRGEEELSFFQLAHPRTS